MTEMQLEEPYKEPTMTSIKQVKYELGDTRFSRGMQDKDEAWRVECGEYEWKTRVCLHDFALLYGNDRLIRQRAGRIDEG